MCRFHFQIKRLRKLLLIRGNAEVSEVDLSGSKPEADRHEAGKTLKQDRESSRSKGSLVRGTKCYQRGIYNNLGQEEELAADPNISTYIKKC